VNPPLVRLVATAPVLLLDPPFEWADEEIGFPRAEFIAGTEFFRLHEEEALRCLTIARWACIPFSLLGAYVCFLWAGELYRRCAGLVALALWCLGPNILAHAQLITPDVGAAAFGVAACYLFWHWLKAPRWETAFAAGVVLGLAELTKLTWLVLIGLWPALWCIDRATARGKAARGPAPREALQLAAILLLGWLVVNVGYGFECCFRRLGDFQFFSRALGGDAAPEPYPDQPPNRFAGLWLGEIPVPLPANYVQGIDLQKRDFEVGGASYLRGQWQSRGWWYYYLYALAIKVPLGTWVLVLLAAGASLMGRGSPGRWRDEVVLLAPALAVLTLVSSQTGFSHHMRYVLPMFPFAMVWASKVAGTVQTRSRMVPFLVAGALAWSVASSLWIYPHSLAYFNELVGGPKGGHRHLLNSNIDWGQDLLFLRRWLAAHPQVDLSGLAVTSAYGPHLAGTEAPTPPFGKEAHSPQWDHRLRPIGPLPGWYAISVNELQSQNRAYAYFLRFTPTAMAGYSIYVYNMSVQQVNGVRQERALPQLPDGG
jgi:4-amino-4-deoxy-L-arabinose transferase-like glycosyltransferase